MFSIHRKPIAQMLRGSLSHVALLVTVPGLSACADSLAPSVSEPQVSLTVAAGAPYTYKDALATSSQKSIQYGINGHSATQPAYLAMPITDQAQAAHGLGSDVFRMDIVLNDGGGFNAAGAPVANLAAAQAALVAAANKGMRVLLVLTDRPTNLADSAGMRLFGRTYATEVINQLIVPSGVTLAAVELGNELDIQAISVNSNIGDASTDYNTSKLYQLRNLYQGMRESFVNSPNASVRLIKRLLNGTQGKTYWITAARRNWVTIKGKKSETTVVPISSNASDQISWHWYQNVSAQYTFMSAPIQGRPTSPLQQLRGSLGTGNFQLWVTEFNRLDISAVSGSCPNDDFGLSSGVDLDAMLVDFAAQPETKALITYELIDQNVYDTNIEARFGLTTYNCPNILPGIAYKSSGDAFARRVLKLRDEREALAISAMRLLIDGGSYAPSDSATAETAAAPITSKVAIRTAVDQAIGRTRWVEALYRRIYRREATTGERTYWVSVLGQGWDRHAVEMTAYGSDEYWYANGGYNQAYVIALYRDIQGRDGDAEGVAYWTWRLDTGTSRTEVARLFLASPENIARVVERAHVMVMGRPATQAEQDFWAPQLYGAATYEELVETLLRTTELSTKSLERRLQAFRVP